MEARKHEELLKIVDFRNVLVHDYLEINDNIVQAIVTKRQYAIMENFRVEWH